MISKPIKLTIIWLLLFYIFPFSALEHNSSFSSFIPSARADEADPVCTPRVSKASYGSDAFQDLVGEKLHFKLSFLWFKRVADAEFYFGKNEVTGRYYAQLIVEARGIVGWITQQRKHVYLSEFELADGGRQLRSIYHMRKVSFWDNEEVFENRMDYAKGKYIWRFLRNGQVMEEKIDGIPQGKIFEDVLSAFYNFRQGAFGEVAYGKSFRINTIPSQKGVTYFSATTATERQRKLLANNGEKSFGGPYLILVDIPPEIFDSQAGDGRIWLNEKMIPLAGLIKDVKGLGDVVGTLEEVSFCARNGNGAMLASNGKWDR
jgi:hypothetical protein